MPSRRSFRRPAGCSGTATRATAAATDVDLLELDGALDRLAKEFPVAAELVILRFFAGMTLDDAAEALGIPRRTADWHWAFARAWLAYALAGG
jgi:DNA-directed RNA polymerase specialized sigma24 family protein